MCRLLYRLKPERAQDLERAGELTAESGTYEGSIILLIRRVGLDHSFLVRRHAGAGAVVEWERKAVPDG